MLYLKEQKYLPIIQAAADRYSVPAALLLAHTRQESNFDPSAYREEPAIGDGSTGMMQILLRTAQGLDANATEELLLDPEYNINLGAKLIRKNLDRYNKASSSTEKQFKDAIAAYNAGTAFINSDGVYTNSKGIPNVQGYVDNVYEYLQEYTNWLANNAPTVEVSDSDLKYIGLSGIIGLGVLWWIIRKNRK
jgi:soluble lytic murein transglycosylase-like protein